jgi:hypothetical protein
MLVCRKNALGRLEELKQKQYTQQEAEEGAGKTKEVLPPAHPELAAKRAAAKAMSD